MKKKFLTQSSFPIQPVNGTAAPAAPSVYVYPITPYSFRKGSNDYILRVRDMLQPDFRVVNTVTRLGILDILLKLPKTDIIYLNWVADIADRRFGYLQIPLLFLVLVLSKFMGVRIAWFVHNDVSHSRKNWIAKKLIRRMMRLFADVVLSHSSNFSFARKLPSLKVFDHPVEIRQPLAHPASPEIDALVWGSVSAYKGVKELARFNYETERLQDLDILVAGKFKSEELYQEVQRCHKPNIQFVNKVLEEEELEQLFRKSRYVLFCYSCPSVLSSAALCKSLSYGKTIIGPHIGAFSELAEKKLIYTYKNFDEMAGLLMKLRSANEYIDPQFISDYAHRTSWQQFRRFLVNELQDSRPSARVPQRPAVNPVA